MGITDRLRHGVAGLALLFALGTAAAAETGTSLLPAFTDAPPQGPAKAAGVIVWSHGRSLTHEDSEAPSPSYLRSFLAADWDVLRFNRHRTEDLLPDSTADLVARVHELKHQGYRSIVLAGQSYGGFIALGAADDNPDVHAVIATAPAAYGSFFDSFASWQENGDALYRLLRGLGHTRVLLAFFHGDDYDPGGRGTEARRILAGKAVPYLVIDQPRDLVGHLAANSGLFVRRYADCILEFAAGTDSAPVHGCDDSWGLEPSAQLVPPPQDGAAVTARTGTSATAPSAIGGRWYGYYPNGREFMLEIRRQTGNQVEALYGVGPSVDGKTPASWVTRQGAVSDGALVFAEAGRSEITFAPTELGTMDVTWRAPDGSSHLEATARRID